MYVCVCACVFCVCVCMCVCARVCVCVCVCESNAPCLRLLVAQPPSDARVAPGHPPAARMHQQQAKEEVRRGRGANAQTKHGGSTAYLGAESPRGGPAVCRHGAKLRPARALLLPIPAKTSHFS